MWEPPHILMCWNAYMPSCSGRKQASATGAALWCQPFKLSYSFFSCGAALYIASQIMALLFFLVSRLLCLLTYRGPCTCLPCCVAEISSGCIRRYAATATTCKLDATGYGLRFCVLGPGVGFLMPRGWPGWENTLQKWIQQQASAVWYADKANVYAWMSFI